MKKILLPLFSIFALGSVSGQEYLDDIMFQTFGWDEYAQTRVSNEGGLYEFHNTRAGTLKANGFDMLWLPPASVSTGGVGYFPTELYNFSNTSWGSETQLKKMLATMNGYGINPIADVVANHRSGTTGWTTFTNPAWGCDAIVSNDEAIAAFNSGNPAVSCKPSGAPDTGEGFDGSRDMDHTNPTVQNGYKEFLNRLKALGFKGWRWDVAKGFGTQYFKDYIATSQPYYSVGEYWDGNVDNLKNWTSATTTQGVANSGAFDFSTYYILSGIIQTFQSQTASNNFGYLSSNGNMPGLAGQYGFADKAVTFVDNHDTFVHDTSFQGSNIMAAYAYILTHPGIPSVFAPHYYGGTYTKDNQTRNYGTGYAAQINTLTAIRKLNGINAYSHVTIDKAEAGLYAAYIKKNVNEPDNVVAVKIGAYDWTPAGSGWILVAENPSLTPGYSTGYKVWSKKAINTPPTITMTPVQPNFTGGSQNVTLSATDNVAVSSIRYTTDGSEPTANSAAYSAPIAVSATTTIKAAAFDNEGLSSGTIVRTYTLNAPKPITIRFNPTGSNWQAPYIHYWGATPSGSVADANWNVPVAMTADVNNPGWFYYTFPNVASVNFLFRNGNSTGTLGTTKTADITNVTQSSCYVWDATSSSYVKSTDCTTLNLATNETEVNSNKTSLQILQNPAVNGELKVKYSNAKGGTINVFDISGKTIGNFRVSSDSAEETFRMNGLKAGVYILQLKADTGTAAAKVIVK